MIDPIGRPCGARFAFRTCERCLHLDEHDRVGVERHEIDLAPCRSQPPREDAVARALQGTLRDAFSPPAERVRVRGTAPQSAGDESPKIHEDGHGAPTQGRGARRVAAHARYFFFPTFALGFSFFSVSEPAIAVAFVACSVLSPPTPSMPRISFNRVDLPTRARR